MTLELHFNQKSEFAKQIDSSCLTCSIEINMNKNSNRSCDMPASILPAVNLKERTTFNNYRAKQNALITSEHKYKGNLIMNCWFDSYDILVVLVFGGASVYFHHKYRIDIDFSVATYDARKISKVSVYDDPRYFNLRNFTCDHYIIKLLTSCFFVFVIAPQMYSFSQENSEKY